MKKIAGPLLKSTTKIKGASVIQRTNSLREITGLIGKTKKQQPFTGKDPLTIVRKKLQSEKRRLHELEDEIKEEINTVVARTLHSLTHQ